MLANEAKRQAVLCWTLAPCGPSVPDHPPGSKKYFEQLISGRQQYAPWMNEVLRYRESHGRDVLDVGSGQGIDAYEYARCGGRVIGIDLAPRHVELARLNLRTARLKAEFVEGDAEAMPFPDNSFDLVSSNGVLHHTPNIEKALGECFRVLRPGGIFTVVLYNRQSLHYWSWQVLWEGVVRRGLFHAGSMNALLSASVEPGSQIRRPTFGARSFASRSAGDA